MVSVSMFDTDKVYFDSISAFELHTCTLFEICTSESLSVHMWLLRYRLCKLRRFLSSVFVSV